MQKVNEVLGEVKDLYREVVGTPAPEIRPESYAAFPPGVDPVRHAMEEVEHLKTLSGWMASMPKPVAWIPQADTFTTDDAYVIRLEIPGVKKEDLKVLVSGGDCVVSGQRLEPGYGEMRPLSLERAWGSFERRFTLPPGGDPDKISAKFKDGLLELRIAVNGFGKPREKNVEVA